MRTLSVLFLMVLCCTSASFAQSPDQKIGYVDQQHILENMPEFKKLNEEIVIKSDQYDKILKGKYEEFKLKSDAFDKLVASKADQAILRDKAIELENLKKSYEDFETNSMAQLRDYYSKKFDPIKQKVNEAIIFAGRQKGYAFLLRMDLNPNGGDLWPVVLYARDTTSNLTSDIMKNLGINAAAASTRKVGLPQLLKK
ncbi:periplasmic chaperone for outer membrane proteins Skp [Dyadobacter soli]|uniref:Periplasmic chaperone for outer membrane proteins Skp n=1 Tax=Dyadobacter soli TaxID=659014 RepID=A0A1G7NV35_9BACT|nr:OmpH family outer membrane protein [Dyadobacter soli]SDF77767.1 periplasmic chaperone for outer membrane proteins Skp [Dyadobacter soli]